MNRTPNGTIRALVLGKLEVFGPTPPEVTKIRGLLANTPRDTWEAILTDNWINSVIDGAEMNSDLTREKLIEHVGHTVVITTYGSPAVNVALECEDCNVTLADADRWTYDKDGDTWDAPCHICGEGPLDLKGHGAICPNAHITEGE